MSHRRSITITALAAMLLLGSLCAVVEASPVRRPIRFERLSLDQGLSQSSVQCIFQDSRGYVWLGTEDGLNRYDGFRFTVYKSDPTDPHSLPLDGIWSIDEDSDGNLWIATDGGGLAMWERSTNRFVRFRHDPDDADALASDYVRTLLVDSHGKIWVGTRDAGLDLLDPSDGTFTHFRYEPGDPTSLSDDRVYVLLEDRASNVWIGTNAGISRYDATNGTFVGFAHDPSNHASLSDDRVRSIFEDDTGALWIGTFEGGLNRFDPASGTFVRFNHDPHDSTSLSHDRVRAILQDAAGRLWVGTSGGLNLFDERDGFVRYLHDPADAHSLGNDHVMALLQDRGGVLWVGTRAGGVSKWNPLTWQFGHHTREPSDPDSLSDTNVITFSEDRTGRLWIGTFGGGLNALDRDTGEIVRFRHDPDDPRSLSSDRITVMLHDRNALWIGTLDAGLNRYDPVSEKFDRFRHDPAKPGSLAADGIMSLFKDSRGRLWVGTFGGGLDRYDPVSKKFVHFRHDPQNPASLTSDRVTAIAETPDGLLWVGTDGGGLNLMDPRRQQFTAFRHDPVDPRTISSDTIFTLHVDPAGALWIGTRGGGLNKLSQTPQSPDAAVFRRYSERDGLPNKVIYKILPDSNGNLWLSTNHGLSRFNPRIDVFTNFDVSHGLQSNEFHYNAGFRSTSGELFFGGVNGFNAFFPERLKRNANVPPVVLTSLLKSYVPVADRGPVDQIREIELGYRDDVLTFEFAALDFSSPEGNAYAYMLEGFDRDWIAAGRINRVNYTNLDAGSYVFRVRAANNDGVWNDDGLAIAVEVAPPPWQTGWAYGGYVLSFVAICFGFVQLHRRKLQREEAYSYRLEQQVNERTTELAQRADELETLNNKLTEASLTDSLTGLANRRFLFEYVEKEVLLVHRRYHQVETKSLTKESFDLAFVMIDLDDFKAINDTCGHAAGDQVLKQVREILKDSCRNSDILIRWGGDEFLIVGRESDARGLETLAERIRTAIGNHAFVLDDGQVVRTTCSIGFASYPFLRSEVDAIPWERVVDVADRAMYVAKRSGRNAWVGFASTETTSPAGLLATIREQPDRLAESGMLEVRTSVQQPVQLAWR